jgi:ferredoxin/flavodoxin---NADP+ reductase
MNNQTAFAASASSNNLKQPLYNATLVERVDITADLVQFKVKPDGGVPSFLPGQYVALGLLEEENEGSEGTAKPKLVKRAYSIGSSPEQSDFLEFYIAIVKEGNLTSRLARLKEGDRLFCAPKITGTFVLTDLPKDCNLVLIATGTGLAPYISMLRTKSTWSEGRSITVIHGVRYLSDLAYRSELESLKSSKNNFTYLPYVSREEPTDGEFKGYVQDSFLKGILKPNLAKDHIFLCGNPAMITDIVSILESEGFREHTKRQAGNLHFEKYW